MIETLEDAVKSHSGEFICRGIIDENNSRTFHFRHLADPPEESVSLPSVPGLEEFYRTFGALLLYFNEESQESAFYIAAPAQWEALDGQFRMWLEGLDEEEMEEYVPAWVPDCIVVGSIPRSGNYLLVPSDGPECGKIFEFEHDGFEFIKLAESLPSFVEGALVPTSRELSSMASHLRFMSESSQEQWWITEMRDNRGNSVVTEA